MSEINETKDVPTTEPTTTESAEPNPTEDLNEPANIDPLETLKAELNESNDKYLRLYSDFDNFRKRSIKERVDLIKTASEQVILSLLPVLDDFERALSSVEDESVKPGLELIYNKLLSSLESQGLKAMITKGAAFDADIHEAVAQVPTADETQKGYYLYDKVIRHAKVVVSN